MTTWQATNAKAQLSAVMGRAVSEGPQRPRHLSRKHFEKLGTNLISL